MVNGAVPVSAAVIVAELPAQIGPVPLTVAVGLALTVTVAPPDEVPPQFASEIEVIVYVVVDKGETVREALVPLATFWLTPSDQLIANGAVPVSVAVIVAEEPAQIVPPPLTVAVGLALTVTVALPDELPPQFASEIELIVYVVVDA